MKSRCRPPTLSYLAGTLYLQAAIALGLLPNPISGKPELHLAQAKHVIDTLAVLQEKTEGNRTAAESAADRGHAAPIANGLRGAAGVRAHHVPSPSGRGLG